MKSKSDGGLPDCPEFLSDLQIDLGFKAGNSGAHSSRTMRLADLTALLSSAPAHAKRDNFNRVIVEENCLGKKTASNRWLTARHLADLYGLDEGVTVFRLLRFFWNGDPSARPMLAVGRGARQRQAPDLCGQTESSVCSTKTIAGLKQPPNTTLFNRKDEAWSYSS
jgi:hypothetical protein